MYSKFENLTEEKRQKIMEVCIEEFSRNGYNNASTNNIVKKAEISKGILFHYFGNKKSLYLYVLKYCTDFITDLIYRKMTDLPADFFERVMIIGLIKLEAAYECPAMYKLLLDAYAHTPDDLKQELKEMYDQMYKEHMPVIFKDIDTSKFRSDIDRKKAMELIMFALEGVSNKYMNDIKNKPVDQIMSELEAITSEYNEYIEILKNGVY